MGRTLVSETSWLDSLAEPECRYPVIVTVHREHVVWIEGDSQKEALENLQSDGEWYEHLGDNLGWPTLTGSWEEMRSPGGGYHDAGMDWDTVYRDGDGGYPGVYCNTHVDSHNYALAMAKREAERAACKVAGHPDLEVRDDKRPEAYCRNCGWLKLAQIVADLRAARSEEGREGDTP